MKKYEFINDVIGEGSFDCWVAAVGGIEKYNMLISREDDLISDVISNNLAKLSPLELYNFKETYMSYYDLDIIKKDIKTIKCKDLFRVNGELYVAKYDSHQNLDEYDEPWIVYDENDNSWFEEDIDTN